MLLWKCCTQYAENSAVATGLEKVSFHFNPKECSNYCTIVLISHTSKEMLKILQARFQQYMNWELLDDQAGFRKGRGTRDQIANIFWIIEKSRRVPEKHLRLLHWLHQSLWLWGSPQTVENSSKDGNTRPPPASWEICMQVKKQQLEPDME